jgi:hypothetical protein
MRPTISRPGRHRRRLIARQQLRPAYIPPARPVVLPTRERSTALLPEIINIHRTAHRRSPVQVACVNPTLWQEHMSAITWPDPHPPAPFDLALPELRSRGWPIHPSAGSIPLNPPPYPRDEVAADYQRALRVLAEATPPLPRKILAGYPWPNHAYDVVSIDGGAQYSLSTAQPLLEPREWVWPELYPEAQLPQFIVDRELQRHRELRRRGMIPRRGYRQLLRNIQARVRP